jgi:hypothetical protein
VETTRDGQPRSVYSAKLRRRLRVTVIRDRWRVDDEWWRSEISRFYYQAVLEDGRALTLFRDLLTERWYRQRC